MRERNFTAQDGLRLYYRDHGDRQSGALPVLCLPGLTRNSADFEDLARRLCPGRRVVCPDYRGRGRSQYDRKRRNYLPETIVNDVVHLLAVADIHRAVFIGASFGGLVAMAMAVAAPSTVAGLVINDIGPEFNHAELQRLLALLGTDRPQPDWQAAETAVREMFPTLAFADPGTWQKMARNTYREDDDGMLHFDWDVAIVHALPPGRRRADYWHLFRAIRRIPTLALRGENSPMLSPGCFDRMALENSSLIRQTVAGAGHTPTLEEPEARVAIDAFLATL